MEDNAAGSNKLLDNLMKRRTVLLAGEITFKTIKDVSARMIDLQHQSPDRITLIIDSGGGNVQMALDLCDLIRVVITAPVRGIALGKCGSAATFIMLHCTERLGAPYSRFLVHSSVLHTPSCGLRLTENLELSVQRLVQEVSETKETLIQMYAARLTPAIWKTEEPTQEARRRFVEDLMKRGDQDFGEWIAAKEAVELGLIEKIVTEKLDIFPKK
jgi:ATP-dependent protease ClpP protease subunit